MSRVNIRERVNVYEYFFERAKVNNKRTRITKSGFKTKNEAYGYGYRAYEEYHNGGIKKSNCKVLKIIHLFSLKVAFS